MPWLFPYNTNTSTVLMPTSALDSSAIANTSLLTFQYGGAFVNYQPVDNSNQHLSFTKNGNATQSIFTPYRRNYSVSFNGTTDLLILVLSPLCVLCLSPAITLSPARSHNVRATFIPPPPLYSLP